MATEITLLELGEDPVADGPEVPAKRLEALGDDYPWCVDPRGRLLSAGEAADRLVFLEPDESKPRKTDLPAGGPYAVKDVSKDVSRALVSRKRELYEVVFPSGKHTFLYKAPAEITSALLAGEGHVAVYTGGELHLLSRRGAKVAPVAKVTGAWSAVESALGGLVLVGLPPEGSKEGVTVFGVYGDDLVEIGRSPLRKNKASLYASFASHHAYGKLYLGDYDAPGSAFEVTGLEEAHASRGAAGGGGKARVKDAAKAPKARIGPHLSAVIAHVRAGKKRKKPLAAAAALLEGPLAPDVEAFVRARAEHQRGFFAVGDLWFEDSDLGIRVPCEGDDEEVRDDVIPIAQSPGGDVFVILRAPSERAVWRVLHDEDWVSERVASSLEQLLADHRSLAEDEGKDIDVDFD